jgi:hypothetical protein
VAAKNTDIFGGFFGPPKIHTLLAGFFVGPPKNLTFDGFFLLDRWNLLGRQR